MKLSAVQAMKALSDANFKLTSDAVFEGFEGISATSVDEISEESQEEYEDLVDQLELWAVISIKYEGVPPESYRVLNSMLMDWIDDNETTLKKLVNPKLIPYLKQQYPDIDVSDLQDDFDDYIWEDQVDYMPDIDEEEKTITFTVELVLDIENEDVNENGEPKEEVENATKQ